jgi:pseudouridine-5'-phosphate glycosidase
MREVMQDALDVALRRGPAQRVSGKAVTPFLLAHIRRTTGGQSLRANRSLIVANARLAGQIAASLPSRSGA